MSYLIFKLYKPDKGINWYSNVFVPIINCFSPELILHYYYDQHTKTLIHADHGGLKPVPRTQPNRWFISRSTCALIKARISASSYRASKTDCNPQPSTIVIRPNGANLRIYPSDSPGQEMLTVRCAAVMHAKEEAAIGYRTCLHACVTTRASQHRIVVDVVAIDFRHTSVHGVARSRTTETLLRRPAPFHLVTMAGSHRALSLINSQMQY